jgi:hypothetical protein
MAVDWIDSQIRNEGHPANLQVFILRGRTTKSHKGLSELIIAPWASRVIQGQFEFGILPLVEGVEEQPDGHRKRGFFLPPVVKNQS